MSSPLTRDEEDVDETDDDERSHAYLGDDIPAADENKERLREPDEHEECVVLVYAD